jgi:hypothetical protein
MTVPNILFAGSRGAGKRALAQVAFGVTIPETMSTQVSARFRPQCLRNPISPQWTLSWRAASYSMHLNHDYIFIAPVPAEMYAVSTSEQGCHHMVSA